MASCWAAQLVKKNNPAHARISAFLAGILYMAGVLSEFGMSSKSVRGDERELYVPMENLRKTQSGRDPWGSRLRPLRFSLRAPAGIAIH